MKTSKYVGVSKVTASGSKWQIGYAIKFPWRASIANSKTGFNWRKDCPDERSAAIAYDSKVLELGLDRPLNILKPLQKCA